MAKKTQFGSRIGLIAATVGSAVGLGNVWRFPAETQANGGAAFLVVYIFCVFLLGIPVMLAEFSLGRGTGADAVGAFRMLAPGKKWWLTGSVATLASFLILSFYMVVAAWTLEYFWQSITGELYSVSSPGDAKVVAASLHNRMDEAISSVWRPLIFTFIMIAVNLLILMRGVQKGIEKMSNIMMPVLFILLLGFACMSMTFPKAMEGLSFFLYPDFSKITPSVAVNALGQAFFSLSLGMGILITYSSYFPKTTNLLRTSVTVSSLDLLVAVLMGFIIFPAVTSFGLNGESLKGTQLVFITLPEVFAQMPGSQWWSALFFLLLLVAAVTSTISLAEVSVAFVQAHFKMSRPKAVATVMVPLAFLSVLCSLSLGVLGHIRIFGFNFFDFLDNTATNIMLPVAAFFTCLFIGWKVPKGFLKKELSNHGKLAAGAYPVILFITRWIAPVLIAVILLANFVS